MSVSRFDKLPETLLEAVGDVETGGVGDIGVDWADTFFRGGGSDISSAKRPYLLSAA
jgi:hypothetical protein